MPMTSGTRLGPYEIVAALGAGGMGEVYKAHDTRLDRTVAIKVLPAGRDRSAELRQRFEREARTISSLNHPHICTLYDIGEHESTTFLVMEYLEGETLQARLDRGALSLTQVLGFAVEIAGALELAHRHGVVHRDLKPANVMLTASGAKLLDFGLAKMTTPATGAAPSMASTMDDVGLTQVGTVLGTLQYMSPEQLEGREADARADIFSFGAMVFEMLTGRKAFEGQTQASLVAAILKEQPPPVSALHEAALDALDHIVSACLVKDREARWQSARDLEVELRWLADRSGRLREAQALPAGRARKRFWIAAVLMLFVIASLLTVRRFYRAVAPARTIRSLLPAPENSNFVSVGIGAGPAVFSPDGRSIAFVASTPDGRRRLWVRRLDSLSAQFLNGTDGASYPFWSPDSAFVGFFSDQKLKKVPASGGEVVTLSDAPFAAGGAWSQAGIVFAPTLQGALLRIPDSGGSAVPATALAAERHERTHRWPFFLPDGRRFLYLSNEEGPPSRWSIRVGSLDSTASTFVLEARSNAVYHNGYLMFVSKGTLLAQPFDLETVKLTGEGVPLAEKVLNDAIMARSVFSVSADGTLVYQTGGTVGGSRMIWLNRSGHEVSAFGEPAAYSWPRISPDGKRVAMLIADATTGNTDIWIKEIDGERPQRLTFDLTDEGNPTWFPDGSRLVFNSTRKGVRDLLWKAASGSGASSVLLESAANKHPQDISPDGRYLIYTDTNPSSGDYDLWLVPFGDDRARPFIAAEGNQTFAQFSPDGRWLAYDSDETGSVEVYVTSFPKRDSKWQVSQQGGIMPKWRRDGREIFYLTQDHQRVFAAEVAPREESFRVTRTSTLFTTRPITGMGYPYDVSADGQRFLFVTTLGEASSPLTLVTNWTAERKK
jgi:eukaryotic-like serine/threonine-protein kinase